MRTDTYIYYTHKYITYIYRQTSRYTQIEIVLVSKFKFFFDGGKFNKTRYSEKGKKCME